MYSKLYDTIMKVDFKQAEKIFMKMSSEEQREIIVQLAYNTESMIIYAFVQYINQKDENVLFHEIEFDMLTMHCVMLKEHIKWLSFIIRDY